MKNIKFITFFNSETKEFIVSVAIYIEDIYYKIITEVGCKISGEIRMTEEDANFYFNEQVKNIKASLINRQIIFTTHEA
jgi:hypothetical protein